MKNRLLGIVALGFLLIAFVLALAPVVRAGGVDDKIQTLENELSRLKSEQMELKKEAVAAAAALPDFSYRPGAGLTITAADQSWAIKFGYEYEHHMLFLAGNDARREGDFQLFGRRNRPAVYYYWDKGFYEFKSELDMDGDETGGKDTLNQRSAMLIHFEQMNPLFPTLSFGMDESGAGSKYRSSDLTLELPTLDRNNGFNTGSHTGLGFLWEDLPTPGLPGNQQFHYYWVIHGMGRSDGRADQSNKMDHVVYYNINPFAQAKNKWIDGIGFSMLGWFGNIDDRNSTNSTSSIGLRSQEGPTRVVLWTSPTRGAGLHTYLSPSLQYKVGPYQLRFAAGFDRYNTCSTSAVTGCGGTTAGAAATTRGRVSANYWKFMNDIMVWSPKGFLTGSATTPNTLGMGVSFERTDAKCGFTGATSNCDQATGNTDHRIAIHVMEVDLRYWIRPALFVGWVWKEYDVSNTPTAGQVATGCKKNSNTVANKQCSWDDFVLRFGWNF